MTSLSLSCIGEGNGNPLQYSCLENPRDGRAGWAAIYGVARSQTRLKRLSSSSSSSIVALFLVFWEPSTLFSIMATQIYIPTNSVRRLSCLYILANICVLFDGSHSDRCGVSLWFWFELPWLVMLNIFSCAFWPYIFPLWKSGHSVLLPVFKSGC